MVSKKEEQYDGENDSQEQPLQRQRTEWHVASGDGARGDGDQQREMGNMEVLFFSPFYY